MQRGCGLKVESVDEARDTVAEFLLRALYPFPLPQYSAKIGLVALKQYFTSNI